MLYRFNGSFQSNNSFRDLVSGEDVFIAPTLKWNISTSTQATLEFEYQRQLSSSDTQALPIVDYLQPSQHFIDLPPSRNLGEANQQEVEKYFVGLNWSHQFNDDWSIKQQVAFKRQNVDYGTFVFPVAIIDNPVIRTALGGGRWTDTVTTNLNLTGHFDTWGLKHTLLFGGDYYRVKESSESSFATDDANIDVDLDNPVHGGPIPLNPSPDFQNSFKTDNYGLYLQDQIKLPYNVQILGGLRYDYVHTTSETGIFGPVTSDPAQTNDAVTPRVGLLWRPQNWLSLYSNYTENFGPNSGLAFGGVDSSGNPLPGKPLKPTSAQQWEVGTKTEFFNGRLRATLAYYDLTKQNVATASPNPAALGFSVAAGEVRSQGPELDIQGEILPGWNVIATYANQDVRVTKSNDTADSGGTFLVGNRLQFVPRNTGSVWSTYEIQQGVMDGFKFGGGVTMQDGSVNNANTLHTPGYALLNLMTGYSFGVGKSKITAQLNIDNLLNKTYFTNADTFEGTIAWGSFAIPRTFIGSINIQY